MFNTGCRKNYVISPDQEILFQYDYVNYTLGYQHNGFIINSKGNVLTYANPESWNFPDNDLKISSKDIEENLEKCKKTDITISPVDLQKYINYINNLASSKVSAPKNVAADIGVAEYICYQFSENDLSYKGSIIKMEGDFTCENLNFYTKKILVWMKEINDKLPNKLE